MDTPLNIVRADSTEIIISVVVFVGIVIAQIAKAARAAKPGRQTPPAPTRSGPQPTGRPPSTNRSASPEDEIRRFLASLSGQTSARPSPTAPAGPQARPTATPSSAAARGVPPPVPTVVTSGKRMRAQPTREARAAAAAAERAPTSATKATPAPKPPVAPIAPIAPHANVWAKRSRSRQGGLHPLLRRTGLRDAIVMREILGPPVALRAQAAKQQSQG